MSNIANYMRRMGGGGSVSGPAYPGGGGYSPPAAAPAAPRAAPTLAPSPAPTPAAPPTPQYPIPQPGPQMPYKPGAPKASAITGTMAGYGTEMLDPNSELSRRMQEILTGRIGEGTEAAKRMAAFQAAQAGMGAGGSPELMAMLGDIDIEGMETGGRASAGLMGQMPGMGLGFLQGALGGELGISSQDLQAWMQQQQLQQQAQGTGMQSYYRGRELDLEQQRINQAAMMNQFAGMFA